jgi:hypothetical protein
MSGKTKFEERLVHGTCFASFMGESIHQLRNVVLLAMKLWRHCRGKWPLFAVDPSWETF